MAYQPLLVIQRQIMSIYIHTYSTKDFKTNIKVGRIFYEQDFICLYKINQF